MKREIETKFLLGCDVCWTVSQKNESISDDVVLFFKEAGFMNNYRLENPDNQEHDRLCVECFADSFYMFFFI